MEEVCDYSRKSHEREKGQRDVSAAGNDSFRGKQKLMMRKQEGREQHPWAYGIQVSRQFACGNRKESRSTWAPMWVGKEMHR